jgi:DNA-binding transcriptional LysR family regulator
LANLNSRLARCQLAGFMVIIDPVDLRGVDLNLLVSLRVLLTQRHVTRSAEKLGLTQPAMSASLARSRTLFRDKLLVRGPKGLVLTPRGEQILDQLNQIMGVTERLIALPEQFTPEICHRKFALMGSDFVEFVLLPSLMATLASEAPNLQILYKSPDRKNHEEMLANSELDLVVGYEPDPPKELIRRTLFHEPFVCVARRGHPLLHGQGLTIEHYVELQHVQVLARDATVYGDDIERAIAAIGLVRNVALWQPTFLAVGNVVAQTDLISTIPSRIAAHFAQVLPIVVYDPPLALPAPDIALYWHPRSQDDPGHKWLRGKITALLKA